MLPNGSRPLLQSCVWRLHLMMLPGSCAVSASEPQPAKAQTCHLRICFKSCVAHHQPISRGLHVTPGYESVGAPCAVVNASEPQPVKAVGEGSGAWTRGSRMGREDRWDELYVGREGDRALHRGEQPYGVFQRCNPWRWIHFHNTGKPSYRRLSGQKPAGS